MKKIIFCIFISLSLKSSSQVDTNLVKFLNPASVHATKGYAQSVQVDLGTSKMVIISGQIALDNQGNLIGKNNVSEQAAQVFTNIQKITEAHGGTMENVIYIGIYMTDITQVQAMRDVRNKFFKQETPPTSTLVQVSKLVRDDLLIEIEATVIIPKIK